MNTPQTQIKINLPLALKDYLESKAAKYDIPIAAYVKHLILNDVIDLDYPTFKISDASETSARKALRDKKKAKKVNNVAQYFEQL